MSEALLPQDSLVTVFALRLVSFHLDREDETEPVPVDRSDNSVNMPDGLLKVRVVSSSASLSFIIIYRLLPYAAPFLEC